MAAEIPVAPIFVSYYTPSYEAVVQNLKRSLLKFNLPNRIYALSDAGSWAKNVRFKPEVILAAMADTNRPVVWLDADAVVKKTPLLFDTIREDVAAHVFRWPDRPLVETLSSCVFFNNTVGARKLLGKWMELLQADPAALDQPVLEMALKACPDVSFYDLPVEYAFIFDIHRKFNPDADPVILQMQHSRTQKK